MMVCMAGLQVFIVRFFFQVCCSLPVLFERRKAADGLITGREEGLCVEHLVTREWVHIRGITGIYRSEIIYVKVPDITDATLYRGNTI